MLQIEEANKKIVPWILLTRSQSTTFFIINSFVETISYMFDQTILHLFDGKYRSATGPLVRF